MDMTALKGAVSVPKVQEAEVVNTSKELAW